jgi:AraC-like DNA-binding protein
MESFRAKMKGRGRPDRWRVPDEEIARLVLQEKSLGQIADQVGLVPGTVAIRLGRLDFPPFLAGPYRFQHGELIATRHLRDTCEDFGLKPLELARRMKVDIPDLYSRLKHYGEDLPLALKWAQKLERVRSRLRRERSPQPASSRGGRPRELLRSEESCIRRQYPKLMQDQLRLRRWLENFEGRIDRRTQKLMWGWLCEQRRLGKIQVLLFWPEFFVWLERTLKRSYLQGGSIAKLGRPLTLDFLARSFHVSVRTIERVIWPGPQATR